MRGFFIPQIQEYTMEYPTFLIKPSNEQVTYIHIFIEKHPTLWTSSLYADLGIAFTIKSRNGEVLTYYNEYGYGYAVRCYEGEPEPSE
jgi:hypothetical protein